MLPQDRLNDVNCELSSVELLLASVQRIIALSSIDYNDPRRGKRFDEDLDHGRVELLALRRHP